MITEGIHYGVSFAQYLSGEGIPSPAVSGSDLVNMAKECPAFAYAFWRNNPDRISSEDTAATAFGSAAHCYILEGRDAFNARYAIKPEDMSFATREGKAWRAAHEGMEIVSAAEFTRIKGMRDALMREPSAARLLTASGVAESTMIAKDPETGLYLMCRPDWAVGRIYCNLKSTRSANPEDFRRQAMALRYDIGAALNEHIASLIGIVGASHCFMVCASDAPHIGWVGALSTAERDNAHMQMRQMLRRFAECVSSNKWPSYREGVVEIAFPEWGAKKISEAIGAAA